MQQIELSLRIEAPLFQLEDFDAASAFADSSRGALYSWKTTGRHNWLERGLSVVDSLGVVVLPADMPGEILMPDDADETD